MKMPLKKQKGNMYEFVTHMWGPIRGKCKHDCSYCYMKTWGDLPPLHVNSKDIRTNLGENNFIFVCHTIDLFADDVPSAWIMQVLNQLNKFPKNRYLLQSKNPKRFLEFVDYYPKDVLFGTTIETNRDIYVESKAPPYLERAEALAELYEKGFETMVTVEPIFDFDLNELVNLIVIAKPEWVNIEVDINESQKELLSQKIPIKKWVELIVKDMIYLSHQKKR
jgi:DNA repair photolyase